MTNFKYLYSLLSIPVLLLSAGCERDLDLDGYRDSRVERMLVVNSILNPDSLIGVSVTHPYFFSKPHVAFTPVKSLEVKMKRMGKEWEPLEYDDASGMYLSSRRPVAGEVVELMINGEEQVASSCDTIPFPVEIEDVQVTGEGPMHIYWDNDYRFTYKITFSDKPGETNYYFLKIEEDAEQYEFTEMGEVDYTMDYVFQMLANMINRDLQGWQPEGVFGYPFSDEGIDGERYTVTVSEVVQTPLIHQIERLPRKIKLYAISKSYFEYMVSVLSMDYDESAMKGNLLSWGLMEPDKIYSNIEGATGIMGCYNLTTSRVDLLKFTGGWPTK